VLGGADARRGGGPGRLQLASKPAHTPVPARQERARHASRGAAPPTLKTAPRLVWWARTSASMSGMSMPSASRSMPARAVRDSLRRGGSHRQPDRMSWPLPTVRSLPPRNATCARRARARCRSRTHNAPRPAAASRRHGGAGNGRAGSPCAGTAPGAGPTWTAEVCIEPGCHAATARKARRELRFSLHGADWRQRMLQLQ
jgi:hypothetical protein